MSSCFDADDGGDEELLEVRGLLAYIDTQEQMIRLQSGELKDLRQQLQERDLQEIERSAWEQQQPTVVTEEIAIQTDAADDDFDYERLRHEHEEALDRAGQLAVELAESRERADALQEDLITTKQQLQACQDKLREIILGHGGNSNNGNKPGLHRFRQKKEANKTTLKSFFMRSSCTSNPALMMSHGNEGDSIHTMPLPSKPMAQPTLIESDNHADEAEVSTIYSAPADVNQSSTSHTNSSFRFVSRREPIANVSFDDDEVEVVLPRDDNGDDMYSGQAQHPVSDSESVQSNEVEAEMEQSFTSDCDNRSYKSDASNNLVTIQKLDAAIEDPRPWKQTLQQRNQLAKVLIIQQAYRRYATKKQMAVVMMQRWWRMVTVRLQFQHCLSMKHRRQAAIVLQCFARTLFALKRYNVLRAAVMIQTKWRSSRQRAEYRDMYWAALVLQPCVRRMQAMRRYQELGDNHYASIAVQKHARGFLLRRDFARTRVLAVQLVADTTTSLSTASSSSKGGSEPLPVSIKAHHRTVLEATKQLITLTSGCPFLFGYAASAPSACLINPLWRMVERNVNVVVIQKTWRRYLQQKQWEACRKDAVMIQTAYRRFQKQRAFHTTRGSVVSIQTCFRCLLARRLLAKLVQEKIAATRNEAATVIQAWMRRFPCQRLYEKTLRATLLLQTRFRMHAAQQSLLHRRKANLSAVIIQLWYGLVSARNDNRARLFTLTTSPHQCLTREHVTIVDSPTLTATLETEPVMNPSLTSSTPPPVEVTATLRRKEEIIALSYNYWAPEDDVASLWEESFDCWDDAAIYVQAFFSRIDKQSRNHATIVIQQRWRRHTIEKARRSSAAHWIQCYWRERFMAKKSAAIVIQTCWRNHIGAKTRAVVLIQNYWRERAAIRSNAAALIQMIWRGVVARLYYVRYQSSAAALDSFLRGRNATTQAEEVIRSKIEKDVKCFLAAIAIQRWWLMINGLMLPDVEDEGTYMVIEFDPLDAIDMKDLAVDKSMSFDQSCLGSVGTRRRMWREKKPTAWKSLREKATVALTSSRVNTKPRGYRSMDEERDRYATPPAAEKDRYAPSSAVVVSDDEKVDFKNRGTSGSRLATQPGEERKPILAKFPTLKLSLDTKKKLKQLKSTILMKKRVDLTDPKVQRKLAEIDSMNWADYDFRDPEEAEPEPPVQYSVSPKVNKSKRSSQRGNRGKKSRSRGVVATPANADETFSSDMSFKRGNLSPLREGPAEVSNSMSDDSFLLDEDRIKGNDKAAAALDDTASKDRSVQEFQATFTAWSKKADLFAESGLADVLETMDVFRVDGK